MKKIDFHIHTVPSISDADFAFSMDKMKEYVEKRGLDGIAITNHNLFDRKQFKEIASTLSIQVYPGVEIDLEGGQLLLIGDGTELEDFDVRCRELKGAVPTAADSISLPKFREIFPDLSKYILIPHYDKKPALSEKLLDLLKSFIAAGEVASPKKFIYCLKDAKSLVPVYFSDLRIKTTLSEFPPRQTYINAGDVSFAAIRTCLRDKNKVSISRESGHDFFDALSNGLKLSTRLNVVLGERSTGKSFTLDQIFKTHENVKYIRQFSLLERSEEADEKRFNEMLSAGESRFTQDYLKKFQAAVDDMSNVDLSRSERAVEEYVASLKKNALESEKEDSFSKAQLFKESDFSEGGIGSLKELIASVIALIDNVEYREIIDRHVAVANLKKLAIELMRKYATEAEAGMKKRALNSLLGNIRKALKVHTAATPIEDVDLYLVAMEREKSKKFRTLAKAVQSERQILEKDVRGFRTIAVRKPFASAQILKSRSGKKIKFSEAFSTYDEPYDYLVALREIAGLEESEYYKCFAHIEYRILNKDGGDVSGGERSEFHLLHEISDSQQFDMLLIDEPESSFDNIFLMKSVNELIKDISKLIPVVVVTHNSTVGASIKPDYVIHTRKIVAGGTVKYELYSGYPSDKFLTGLGGDRIENLEVMLNCLEAGSVAYSERSKGYEILKDRR